VVEPDYSAAAFWFVAAALGFDVNVRISHQSIQGDFAIIRILQRFGATLKPEGKGIRFSANGLSGCHVDASDIPDLVPALAVLGALVPGRTQIFNTNRLKFKEIDRINAMVFNLRALGAKISYEDGVLTMDGQASLQGGSVSSFGDHRIAMAMCIAALKCSSGVKIDDLDCIKKSYPGFVSDFLSLGGEIGGI
jgi:3-phosphoshikimate 1-carboxyvinyltransferase